MSRTMIINRKSVRYRRERDVEGKGQAWVCARDFLLAAGVAAPRSLVGDLLADHLGAEAVRTAKVHSSDGTIHRLIFVHAEACQRLVKLYSPDGYSPVAHNALRGLSMQLEVKFTPTNDAPAAPATKEPEVNPEVQTYDFNGMALRVVLIDGDPWFVAQDVCRTLDLAIDKKTGNVCFTPSRYPSLGSDEVALHLVPVNLKDGRNQRRRMHHLSESGLYKLVMRSDKPQAKAFQDWVTRDVLPAIRKTGSYSLTDGVEPVSTDQPALTGEVIAPTQIDRLEASFMSAVADRKDANLKRACELRTELRRLELSINKDNRLLELLAA